jgi:hypothetical protein
MVRDANEVYAETKSRIITSNKHYHAQGHARSTCRSWATFSLRLCVMLPAGTFEMRKSFNLFLGKAEIKRLNNFKNS